jgi:hypothetical protein
MKVRYEFGVGNGAMKTLSQKGESRIQNDVVYGPRLQREYKILEVLLYSRTCKIRLPYSFTCYSDSDVTGTVLNGPTVHMKKSSSLAVS